MREPPIPDELAHLEDAEVYQQLQAAKKAVAQDLLCDPVTLARGLDPRYRLPPHLRVMANALVELERGDYDRLMVFTPSQVGKSTTVAEWFPFRWLCLHGEDRVAVTSYSDDLAMRRGKTVRRYITEYGDEYDLELLAGSSAAQDYDTTAGGGVRSVSIGSGLTGFDVNLLIVDDPHKDRAEAESARLRGLVHDWWSSVEELVPPGDDATEAAVRALLASRYNTVRPFLTLLGRSTALGAASGGRRVLAAVQKLPALSRRRVKDKPLLPREIDSKLVPPAWRRAVLNNADLPAGAVDRDAYVVCVLEQLYRALQRRDVFASPSNRWSDPRARLLDGKAWEAVREDTLAGLSLNEPVEEHLKGRVKALDAAWQLMAEPLEEAGQDAKLSFEIQPNGRLKLNVDRLGALGESASLKWLRQTTAKMLLKFDLPDLLFEVDSWTGFLDAFVHLGDGRTRMEDIKTSLVALLVSEACNIGYTPVIDADDEALTRARLVHVDQYYLRVDTIAAANAKLIEAQAKVSIVKFWGEGLLASVDGLRFVVPKRTIHAGPSPKYYHFKRGITWLNAVNDQVAGIGLMVVPGTPRDSLHILDALLNLDAGVKREMVATDNASYSDMVFGLFTMLGYNFSPRFKDLGDQRFWRAEMPGVETGGYGPLEDLARNKVNLSKVTMHWPEMLRVAGSLVTGQVRAYDLLRMFGREGRPTPLGQAFAEYGRIAKTLHLLRVVDPVDDTYRRQMNRQLTVQESRHKLARDICHGKRGQIMQAYRTGQEDQLGALGLVLNAAVLWTTRYLDAAVDRLRALPPEEREHDVLNEDVARISPLKHANLNCLGRYSFAARPPREGLRPLRDPATVHLDEDDEGTGE
ncbi:Tn3 family transposase [Streptomyces sp. NPDC007896]|uniref:Tn3 family transposase n=1 Tax=Streptomyces sp. NPDC007896 TaxID=3364784 RepID=UPI0036EFE67F